MDRNFESYAKLHLDCEHNQITTIILEKFTKQSKAPFSNMTKNNKLEFNARELRNKLDKINVDDGGDLCLRFCVTGDNFCQGVVESTANGWRKMRLTAPEASVVSTTFMAKQMHSDRSKDPNSHKKCLGNPTTDHRDFPREMAIFIGNTHRKQIPNQN